MRRLIHNCRVYSMEGPVLEKGFVLLEGSTVRAVGSEDALPSGAFDQVIDGAGGYLLPGLVDAHTHIGLFNESLRLEGEDGNEDTDPITPQLRALDAVNPQDRGFADARRAGVTTVVTGPGSANPIGGVFAAMKTRGVCADRMLIREAAAMKLALGENPKITYNGKERAPVTRMATAALIREALFKTQEYIEKRGDPEEDMEFDMKYAALAPLLTGELPAQIHCHRADDIFTALRIAREFSLRCILVHCTDGHRIRKELAEEGAPVIVGPVLTTRTKPELSGQEIKNAAALAAAGLTVALCSDYPETAEEHLMLSAALAAREGLTEEQAFAMITINPARIMGIDSRVGSLAPGKDGDLVLYDGHPFDTRTRVRLVTIQNELID